MNDPKATAPRRRKLSKLETGAQQPPQLDAVAQIDEVIAALPDHDELARRARAVLALQAPTREDMTPLVEHWRLERASWGDRNRVPEVKEDEE